MGRDRSCKVTDALGKALGHFRQVCRGLVQWGECGRWSLSLGQWALWVWLSAQGQRGKGVRPDPGWGSPVVDFHLFFFLP